MKSKGTRERALGEARQMLQRFGFNGFSFGDIAKKLRIKAPSLYDHFASKEDLGNCLIESYQDFLHNWNHQTHSLSSSQKIRALFSIFVKFSEDRSKICPITALSADFQTLPKSMQKKLRDLLEAQERWLEDVIREGARTGEFFVDDISAAAASVYAMGLGSQSLARIYSDSKKIDMACEEAIRFLTNQNAFKRKEAK